MLRTLGPLQHLSCRDLGQLRLNQADLLLNALVGCVLGDEQGLESCLLELFLSHKQVNIFNKLHTSQVSPGENHGCQQKISPALKPQIQIFSNPEIKNKTRKLLILLSVSCLLTHLVAFYDACYCYGPAVDTILTPYTHMEARSTLTLQPIDC